jgi:hypothetical protein
MSRGIHPDPRNDSSRLATTMITSTPRSADAAMAPVCAAIGITEYT